MVMREPLLIRTDQDAFVLSFDLFPFDVQTVSGSWPTIIAISFLWFAIVKRELMQIAPGFEPEQLTSVNLEIGAALPSFAGVVPLSGIDLCSILQVLPPTVFAVVTEP